MAKIYHTHPDHPRKGTKSAYLKQLEERLAKEQVQVKQLNAQVQVKQPISKALIVSIIVNLGLLLLLLKWNW